MTFYQSMSTKDTKTDNYQQVLWVKALRDSLVKLSIYFYGSSLLILAGSSTPRVPLSLIITVSRITDFIIISSRRNKSDNTFVKYIRRKVNNQDVSLLTTH